MSSNLSYILDLERTVRSGYAHYWKPNRMGYTSNLNEAGLYSEHVAREIADNDVDKRTVVINKHVVDNIN